MHSLFTTELAAVEHLYARERALRAHAAGRRSSRRLTTVLASLMRPTGVPPT